MSWPVETKKGEKCALNLGLRLILKPSAFFLVGLYL